MANYAALKAAIQNVIKTNGNNEITGALLQQVLLSMINSLGVGYAYKGMATPSTNPGTPDQKVFYFAAEAGTYPNFDGIVLSGQEFATLYWDEEWHIDIVPIAGPFVFGTGTNSARQSRTGAVARGIASFAEGSYTETKNSFEHAEGRCNKSNTGTRHSVGIGTTAADRKNAFEIMQNGDMYVVNLGGYDGTNPAQANVQTLQQLINLIQSTANRVIQSSKVEINFPDVSRYHSPEDRMQIVETLSSFWNNPTVGFPVPRLIITESDYETIYNVPGVRDQVCFAKAIRMGLNSSGRTQFIITFDVVLDSGTSSTEGSYITHQLIITSDGTYARRTLIPVVSQ